jgi:excisionase family DNA binding protein
MKTHTNRLTTGSPDSLGLTPGEIDALFVHADWAARFPPILSVQQAAELLQVPVKTIYDWSSRGQLKRCSRRLGKHLRFVRSRLLLWAFNEGLNNEKA